MPRRGLEQVLHHFIPEDEQRAARERSASAAREPSGASVADARAADRGAAPQDADAPERPSSAAPAPRPAVRGRWLLPLHPERPLARALALDLAAELPARDGIALLASFPLVGWTARLPDARGLGYDPGALEHALAAVREGEAVLVLCRPSELGKTLAGVPPGRLDGVLLPVDAAPWGLAQALGWLRDLGDAAPRIGAFVVGAASPESADEQAARLCAAARRQLGLRVESLGSLPRDRASYRSLLHGVPVTALDAEAGSARALRHFCQQLGPSAGASP